MWLTLHENLGGLWRIFFSLSRRTPFPYSFARSGSSEPRCPESATAAQLYSPDLRPG